MHTNCDTLSLRIRCTLAIYLRTCHNRSIHCDTLWYIATAEIHCQCQINTLRLTALIAAHSTVSHYYSSSTAITECKWVRESTSTCGVALRIRFTSTVAYLYERRNCGSVTIVLHAAIHCQTLQTTYRIYVRGKFVARSQYYNTQPIAIGAICDWIFFFGFVTGSLCLQCLLRIIRTDPWGFQQ